MKQNYLFLVILFTLNFSNLRAQVPAFPEQTDLSEMLDTDVVLNSASKDTIHLSTQNAENFSLEFKAKLDAATGRGLDVFYKNEIGMGFRTSLTKTELKNTTNLPRGSGNSKIGSTAGKTHAGISSTGNNTKRKTVNKENLKDLDASAVLIRMHKTTVKIYAGSICQR